MPSLLKAIRNSFRAKKDQAAAALGDNVRDGKFAIEDSEKQVQNLSAAIRTARSNAIQIESRLKAAKEEAKKYGNLAKQAAGAGNKDDVAEAITKKNTAEQRAKQLETQVKINNAQIDNNRKTLEQSKNKIASAKSDHSILAARKESANARKALASTSASFDSDKNPLAALDDLKKSVEADKAEAQAYEEEAGVGETTLEDKYGSAGDSSVDDEVEKLMAAAKK